MTSLRRLLWLGAWLVGALAGLLLATLAGIWIFFPRAEPALDLTIERTPERVDRGRYLVESVAACLNCHSERDWSLYAGPVVPGTEGAGAPLRLLRASVHSANVTPAGVGEMTDGELVRAVTAGINRGGGALHRFMPYDRYSQMSEPDVYAVVAYLRTLPSLEHEIPESREAFPQRLIGRVLPKPWIPPAPPDESDAVAFGRYLATIAGCGFCHGSDYGGGATLRVPGGGQVTAPNLTSAAGTKLAGWSRSNFVGVFKAFDDPESRAIPAVGKNTAMPWLVYAGMTERDLGALYAYLRSLPTVPLGAEPKHD